VNAAASSGWRGRLWLYYLIGGGLLTAAYLWFPPLKASGPLINVLGLSSSIAIGIGIYLHRPRSRAWWFFIVGQFLFFAGDLYTYSYRILSGADVGFPSIGDALYLAVYPALMAGLFVLVRRRTPRRDPAAWIDALILTIGFGLLSWVFLIAPNVHLSGQAVTWFHPARGRRGQASPFLLPPHQQHRLPARHRLGLQPRAAQGHLQP
jgi:hypothetical protein